MPHLGAKTRELKKLYSFHGKGQFDGNIEWGFDCFQQEHEDQMEIKDWTKNSVSDQSVSHG